MYRLDDCWWQKQPNKEWKNRQWRLHMIHVIHVSRACGSKLHQQAPHHAANRFVQSLTKALTVGWGCHWSLLISYWLISKKKNTTQTPLTQITSSQSGVRAKMLVIASLDLTLLHFMVSSPFFYVFPSLLVFFSFTLPPSFIWWVIVCIMTLLIWKWVLPSRSSFNTPRLMSHRTAPFFLSLLSSFTLLPCVHLS